MGCRDGYASAVELRIGIVIMHTSIGNNAILILLLYYFSGELGVRRWELAGVISTRDNRTLLI